MKKTLKFYYVGDRIFVIGTYASGKTTFAQAYSELYNIPFKCFDNFFRHDKAEDSEYIRELLESYPESFLVDTMPYLFIKDENRPDFSLTIDFIKKRKAKVVCTVCTNPVAWINRIIVSGRIFHTLGSLQYANNLEEGVKNGRQAVLTSIRHFSDFYFVYLKSLITAGVEFEIYDSFSNSFIDLHEMYDKIYWARPSLIGSAAFRDDAIGREL